MSVPAERVWTVETAFFDPQSQQFIEDTQATTQAMVSMVGTMQYIGGVLTIASRRVEVAPGRAITTHLIFRWRSFVPMEKAQTAPPAEQDGAADQPQAGPPPAEVDDGPPPEFVEVNEPESAPVTHDTVVEVPQA